MRAKDAVGAYGERVAARWLEDEGYVVLDRNWRCRSGELDVVAMRGGVVVFVEVKCRRSDAFGVPALAVTPAKVARLRAAAAAWLADRGLDDASVRFDVVSVLRPPAGAAVLEHFQGAF
ncbi:MAG TPA: YraN family protein [Frankiaceae bacterium]|nr:YraN family protein [Frankiaceae bacterium]